MLSDFTFLCLLLVWLVAGEPPAPGFDLTVNPGPGVTSLGYNVIYGDEDMTMFNEALEEVEKKALRSKIKSSGLKELPIEDVKCLMSADHYCTKAMKEIKDVLIQAVQNDCEQCSIKQKENAGRVIASMMAFEPTAWKMFLTRTTLQIKPKNQVPERKPARQHYRTVGEPEEVTGTKRFTLPGVKVRVKRYAMEKVEH